MSEENSQGRIDAERDFLTYGGKDPMFIAEKYIDSVNRMTELLDIFNSKGKVNNKEAYDYEYCSYMEECLGRILADHFLQRIGYTKDKHDMWVKKKKGLFR